MRAWLFAVVVLAVMTLTPSLLAQAPPSLAEIAAKEQERRQRVETPGKVYTNADLVDAPVAPAPSASPAAAVKAGSKTTAATSEQPTDDDPILDVDKQLQVLSKRAGGVLVKRNRYISFCAGQATIVQPATPQGTPLDAVVIGGTDALVAQGLLLPPGTGPGSLQIPNETTPECRILKDEIATESASIIHEITLVEDSARRKGILPGVVRDLLAKHGLQSASELLAGGSTPR
ncbi:MAG: hypothetical protein HYY76_12285 [Acidobacteria bacterium]|nr:hypothetical protein [Acidobacteriota bacterium]